MAKRPDVGRTDPVLLSQVIALGDVGESSSASAAEEITWGEHELADILRHQLAAPLLFDLGRLQPAGSRDPVANPGNLEELTSAAGGAPIASFGELLRHPTPPLELLALVKEFGRSGSTDPDGPLPPAVGTLLYYAAIVAALVRHGRRMTGMDDQSLRKGIGWVLKQPWVDEETRGLFREGLTRVGRQGV